MHNEIYLYKCDAVKIYVFIILPTCTYGYGLAGWLVGLPAPPPRPRTGAGISWPIFFLVIPTQSSIDVPPPPPPSSSSSWFEFKKQRCRQRNQKYAEQAEEWKKYSAALLVRRGSSSFKLFPGMNLRETKRELAHLSSPSCAQMIYVRIVKCGVFRLQIMSILLEFQQVVKAKSGKTGRRRSPGADCFAPGPAGHD